MSDYKKTIPWSSTFNITLVTDRPRSKYRVCLWSDTKLYWHETGICLQVSY